MIAKTYKRSICLAVNCSLASFDGNKPFNNLHAYDGILPNEK
jgi:hypothetical protein